MFIHKWNETNLSNISLLFTIFDKWGGQFSALIGLRKARRLLGPGGLRLADLRTRGSTLP